ncbi:G/T mismatch-specific thymine DNA glycosylase [Exaiptasia diaphana]|nr:G/T mismatch-specific thymine DNA glycosylase [Exaiptasia diaphana]
MRTTRGSSDLSRKEIKDGVEDLISKIKRLKPLVACFNGKGIYEIFSRSKCEIGNQPDCIPGTDVPVYVMPSTSGRTMTYPRASDKLRFFQELKELRDARKAMLANTVAEDNT